MACKYLEKKDMSVGNDMFDHPWYMCKCLKDGKYIAFEAVCCETCPDREEEDDS